MNTFLLDIRGLVTLPGFKDQVIEPLKDKGHIRFWTLEDEEVGLEMLQQVGLEEYGHETIFGDETVRFVENIRQWGNPGERSLEKFFHNPLTIPEDLLFRGRKWQEVNYELGGGYHKFPPILGEGPFMLVESDSTHNQDWNSELKRSLSRLDYLGIAKREGYSIILTPEHPAVWEKPHGISHIKQEAVTNELRKKLLSWDGSSLISDLGAEMGVYSKKERS